MPEEERQEKRRRGIPSPFAVRSVIRIGMATARAVGAIAGFFANPASLAILVPVGLFILALFVILFGGTGFTGAPGAPAVPGVTGVPQSTFPPGVASSCPISGGRITCGSYGSPETLNADICSRGNDGSTGHCSQKYRVANLNLCNPMYSSQGTLTRTAKGIDIPAPAETPVYLPKLGGNDIDWYYQGVGGPSYGGYYRMFKTEDVGTGSWSLYFFHVEENDPVLSRNTPLKSGTVGAKVYNMSDPHVHVNIGFNIKNFGGYDYFDPGWQNPDTQVGMCQ